MSHEIRNELKYTKEHEWIQIDGDTAIIGITDFAQAALGDIVFVELPEAGSQYNSGDTFGVVESIKSVSDLFVPLTGEVIEKNETLEATPDLCNQGPYDSWMIKMKLSNASEVEGLLDAAGYEDFCNSLN